MFTYIAILPNKMILIKRILGSSLSLPAHWAGGARAKNSAVHFALQNTNPVGTKSEGAAEGGGGGNSAAPERSARAKRGRSFVGIRLVKGSDFVQETQLIFSLVF